MSQYCPSKKSSDKIVYDILYGRFSDFSKEEQTKMKRCCYGRNGFMSPIVSDSSDVFVWAAFRIGRDKELLGWTLRVKESDILSIAGGDGVMIYIKPRYRRLGIGTELIKAASKRCKKLTYWPTYDGSFFYPYVKEKLRGKTLLRQQYGY